MDVIFFVDDLHAGIERDQSLGIFTHRQASRGNAIPRHWVAIRIAPGVIAISHPSNLPIVRRIAVCAGHALTLQAPESRQTLAASDLPPAPKRIDRLGCHP